MIYGIYTGKHPVHQVLFENVCDRTVQFAKGFVPLWIIKQMLLCPEADIYVTENNFYAPLLRKIKNKEISIINLLSSPYILQYPIVFSPFINYIDKQVCLGSLSRELFLKVYPNYKNSIYTIYPFVLDEDLKLIEKAKKSASKKSDVFVITTVANGSYKIKGLDLLEQAISKINRSLEVNIIGNTNFVPRDHRIKLLGRLDKYSLYKIVASSNLYVQPSRLDIFPVSVLEALHLGVPTLVSDMVGAKEFLQKDMIFCSCDVSDLRNKILSNLNNPNDNIVITELPSQSCEIKKFEKVVLYDQ